MKVQISIAGLSEEEKAAQEILEHIEAILELQRESMWIEMRVKVEAEDETASDS